MWNVILPIINIKCTIVHDSQGYYFYLLYHSVYYVNCPINNVHYIFISLYVFFNVFIIYISEYINIEGGKKVLFSGNFCDETLALTFYIYIRAYRYIKGKERSLCIIEMKAMH